MSETAAGPAHVATVSFLASRVTPTGGFWIALAGGAGLARVAERRGLREGFGASAAAMLETVAIIGPARFGVPLTQALSAPLLGRLEARSVSFLPQFLVCAAIRLAHNTLTTAFFIWVITGGLDAYAGTYDSLARRVGIEGLGDGGALALTAAGLLVWAAFASAVQVAVYRRGLRCWPDVRAEGAREGAESDPSEATPPRFDPRAIALAAAVAFGLLLASTDWLLLAAVAAWLAVAWAVARPEREGSGLDSHWPPSFRRAPSSSAWGAGSGSVWRRGAPCAPPCSCSWPPGSARRRARRACGRWPVAALATSGACQPCPRPSGCSIGSAPSAAWPPPGAPCSTR